MSDPYLLFWGVIREPFAIWRMQSKNGLIASELAVDDPTALARDDCRNDRTKVNIVELN